MTWRELSPEQLIDLKNAVVIDVRSPCEHVAESIPGAINIPLLDDAERAEVGTLYKQEGEIVARRSALRIISPKIPRIVDEIIAAHKHGETIVVHCWRGGLRSEAVVSFLAVVGIDSWRLTGGYKAWRHLVLQQLQGAQFRYVPVILHGQTGVGKTDLLGELTAGGASVLDLEALANHRGSVFGGLGLGTQPSQKNFDAALWLCLRRFGSEAVYMEAESRNVGRITLPDTILNNIQTGRRILVTGSIAVRAERIWREYAGRFNQEVIEAAMPALGKLKERLGGKRFEEIKALVGAGNIREAIEILLIEYYDPLYDAQIKKFEPFDLIVDGDHPERAAREIIDHSPLFTIGGRS